MIKRYIQAKYINHETFTRKEMIELVDDAYKMGWFEAIESDLVAEFIKERRTKSKRKQDELLEHLKGKV